MGKKSKANRKKAPVATAEATATVAVAASAAAAAAATVTASTVAVTTSATATAGEAISAAKWDVRKFPESMFFVKGKLFRKKGNVSKANKMYLQGIEHGCVRCLNDYTYKILVDGASSSIENMKYDAELINNNMNIHLALPLVLEGAIRGNHDAIAIVFVAYDQARHNEKDGCRYGHRHSRPAAPLVLYWKKIGLKNFDRGEDRNHAKQENKEIQEDYGTRCSVCDKEDSETVTLMKCDGCKFYYYCSKECQKKMWQEGQHAGVCRHLRLLNKYHKPFAKKIRRDLVVHRMAPRDIPELQELRQRLGLCRPQVDYQDLLDAAKTQQLDPAELILPRKDGTVQIGSFPRPI